MFNIPINHKTVFLFDHSSYFASQCGQTFEFDANKPKSSSHQQQTQKLEPLNKSLWTCCIEAAFEYSRIVYDLYPENKLIRMVVTKLDIPLNSWNETEQGLEHVMNVMGNILPPIAHTRQLFENEEFINLCKGLNIAVNSIAQISEMQQGLLTTESATEAKASKNVSNSGRIILFTSARNRNLDQIQEFLSKSIEECNKNIENLIKNEKQPSCLSINQIELVICDVIPIDHNLMYDKELIKKNSKELRTRIFSCKAGQYLPLKMINLVQNFYELGVTSVTNIPMKEELNANSSANYDVDILHPKSLHDQLKICGILKNCLIQKDGIDTVCLKWSNPKTNITEFNFSSSAYRITPTDVNSRPASCLTQFLLSGRCVVLEVNNRMTINNTRISSHVLCAHAGELFMHCLNCCGRSNLDERPTIENFPAKLNQYRIPEFVEFIKTNTLANLVNDKPKDFSVQKFLNKLEKNTRKWPIVYNETFISNLFQSKKLISSISEDVLTDPQFTECIKCLEYFQNCDFKNENFITPLKPNKEQDLKTTFWIELESWLKLYQDSSERHKILYSHTKIIRDQLLKTQTIEKPSNKKLDLDSYKKVKTNDYLESSEFEADKLSKRKRFTKDLSSLQEKTLLDFWTNVLNEKNKLRNEFYGRVSNPNSDQALLYQNLKADENQPSNKSIK